MILVLLRHPSTPIATIGRLWMDGEPFCWTLEDPVRERPGVPVSDWKIPGKTAIPAGRYGVVLTMSPRFKRELPLLVDVPGFAGVRIHAGNRATDTEGCILPGMDRGDDFVGRSKEAEAALIYRLSAARTRGDPVTLDVRNHDEEVIRGRVRDEAQGSRGSAQSPGEAGLRQGR